jgi:hypothetical protein
MRPLVEAHRGDNSHAPEVTLALIGNGPEILPNAKRHHIPWIHGRRATVNAALIADAHATASA